MSAVSGAERSDAAPLSLLAASLQVIRRNGSVTPFDGSKIGNGVTKAFREVEGQEAATSRRVKEIVDGIVTSVTEVLVRKANGSKTCQIEDIQDQVELALMRADQFKVAKAYILYRDTKAKERAKKAAKGKARSKPETALPNVKLADGTLVPLDDARVRTLITEATTGLDGVNPDKISDEFYKNIYDGITETEVAQALVMSTRICVEQEPNYTFAAARLLLDKIRTEVLSYVFQTPTTATQADMATLYAEYFPAYINTGITRSGLLDPELELFDLPRLSAAIKPERDLQFTFMSLQTLYDRYFLHVDKTRYELPQAFFMRVAMGLAIREIDRDDKAIEFYNLLSSFDYMTSTPTLFNSGTRHPQMSSCFLTTIGDDLKQIFKGISDNAALAKFSGGIGNDWSNVRGLGSLIKGTNGKSDGVVPFLKVANNTAIAVNQGGKRKGAVCAYLQTWHLDIEDYLDLRKNTGDDRRRTHDMNTANWIPDLFMQRVEDGGTWTLFSPNDTPDLVDLYGSAFQTRYEHYEQLAKDGQIKNHKVVKAVDLWRKMLSMLFETGHPWITFKDPCNIRSPQRHVGVVHSSNLCTEITLNTSLDEVAVCNLGSINLANHTTPEGLDLEHLRRTIRTAMRMLDNVIDINLYNIPEARRSNLRHRPVGIGMMGFQDALYTLRLPYASDAAVQFADESQEAISYFAIEASSDLAVERGAYPSYEGSLWSQGIFPIDSIDLLEQERGRPVLMDRSSKLDWAALKAKVAVQKMRNSNTMAIAPTATISDIVGVRQSIEPSFSNLSVRSTMSGDFTTVTAQLVRDLKALDLWDEVMITDLKYYDGSLSQIDRIPADIKALYPTAFEIEPKWLLEAGSRRQKWLDQSQSLNLYVVNPSGKKLDEMYRLAWNLGLKTTYYLRSISATSVEKSTLNKTDGKLNAVSVAPAPVSPTVAPVIKPAEVAVSRTPLPAEATRSEMAIMACAIDNPDCEACQ